MNTVSSHLIIRIGRCDLNFGIKSSEYILIGSTLRENVS